MTFTISIVDMLDASVSVPTQFEVISAYGSSRFVVEVITL